jgi:quercetin dioxygenase-like cupin family protein
MSTVVKAETCIDCGEVVDLKHTPDSAAPLSTVLVQSDELQVTRLELAAGKGMPPQRTVGDVTVQCLEGRVNVCVGEDATKELGPGDLLYLCAKVPHSVEALEDSVLLVSMGIAHDEPNKKSPDPIDQAMAESFPASDSPAHEGAH